MEKSGSECFFLVGVGRSAMEWELGGWSANEWNGVGER